MANPNDFLLNTDYEMDKIVYFWEGSFNITQTHQSNTVTNNLGFLPLVFGIWSENKDFSDPHRMSSGISNIYSYASNVAHATIQSYQENNPLTGVLQSRYFYIEFDNIPTGTVYVRLYGLEPDNVFQHIASTAKYANTFILNTDYNYRKLLKKGRIELVDSNNSGFYDPVVIDHNLNYIPQVMLWIEGQLRSPENPDIVSAINIDYFSLGYVKDEERQNTPSGAILDNKKLTFCLPGGTSVNVKSAFLH